jgi:signal-transduction protein with cAMP-binding, CBS, and nucleotidyltransferase domain
MDNLRRYIKSKIDINEEELDVITSNFLEVKVVKDKFAIKQGQLATNYFFVAKGGLRIYFDHNDKQITTWLALENEFFTDISSLKNQKPSKFNFQAIEDTILLTIKSDKMEQLYKQFPKWQKFGREVWETNFMNLVEGVIRFQTLTAEERYLALLKDSDILQRIPLKYLASFLGITQTSLSRLRKKIGSLTIFVVI